MGYEVEVKFRSVDHAVLEQRLTELGAELSGSAIQVDTYLTHPARDFAATNEAFRVRQVGNENRITYKGPRKPGPTKTREEIEIRFADGALAAGQLLQLFEVLGFRPVATIRKRRTSFHMKRGGLSLEVTLDLVESLGDFAEIEALVPSEHVTASPSGRPCTGRRARSDRSRAPIVSSDDPRLEGGNRSGSRSQPVCTLIGSVGSNSHPAKVRAGCERRQGASSWRRRAGETVSDLRSPKMTR